MLFDQAPRLGDDPAAAYLESRGIPLAIAVASDARYFSRWPHWERSARGEWVLRHTSRRVVFPVRDQSGHLVAIQGRVIASHEPGPKVVTRGDLGAGLFQTDEYALSGKWIVLVEAPIDALSLAAAGVPAVALCGTNVPVWLPVSVAFRQVALAFDADAAGDKASAKVAATLGRLGCVIERWRPVRKDWNEVLVEFGTDKLRADLLSG
jgi:DNA primase